MLFMFMIVLAMHFLQDSVCSRHRHYIHNPAVHVKLTKPEHLDLSFI